MGSPGNPKPLMMSFPLENVFGIASHQITNEAFLFIHQQSPPGAQEESCTECLRDLVWVCLESGRKAATFLRAQQLEGRCHDSHDLQKIDPFRLLKNVFILFICSMEKFERKSEFLDFFYFDFSSLFVHFSKTG